MRKIKYIVIHCTATGQNAKVESIQNYWKNYLKWKSPGYHILIEADGSRNYLQSFDIPSNGVKRFNNVSIHISYIGGVDSKNNPVDNRTEKQKVSILTAIKEAMDYCVKTGSKPIIQGHKDFPNVKKACPSFDSKKEYLWITK